MVFTIEKNYDMNIFFTKSIWLMPPNDENISELDGETWKIKARSGNREMVLSRHLFKDSIYFISRIIAGLLILSRQHTELSLRHEWVIAV